MIVHIEASIVEFLASWIPLTSEIISSLLCMYQAGVKVPTIVQKLTKGGVLFLQVANLPIPTINLILLLVVYSAKCLIFILDPEDFLAAYVSLPP
jgi:hypothetical protein